MLLKNFFFIMILLIVTGTLQAAEEPPILLRPPAASRDSAPKPAPKSESKSESKSGSSLKSNTGLASFITITAKQGINWHRDLKFYSAKGDALIRNGDSTIAAKEIKIFYEENKNNSRSTSDSTVFTRIETYGDTVMVQNGNRLTGEMAVIYLDSLESVVTGKGLSFTTSGGEVVTARDSLEYREVTKLAVARGNAKAVQGDRTMTADIITASMAPASPSPSANFKAAESRQFSRINGFGLVNISSPAHAAAGDRGSYDLLRNLAVLSGNVKLGVGASLLSGDYGELDMNNGTSRILMGSDAASAGQKLRGIIVPNDLRNKPSPETTARPK